MVEGVEKGSCFLSWITAALGASQFTVLFEWGGDREGVFPPFLCTLFSRNTVIGIYLSITYYLFKVWYEVSFGSQNP
jgi:hypothetical protein